jgi:hypothetical protein
MLLEELPALAGRFDLVINTANQPLDWSAVMGSGPTGSLASAGSRLAAHTSWCFRFDFLSSVDHG